jgi:transposase
MLNVSEKTVQRWKHKYEEELKSQMQNPGHAVFQHLLTPKEEPVDEDYDSFQAQS